MINLVSLVFPFYSCLHKGIELLNDLSKVVELVSDGVKIQIQGVWHQNVHSSLQHHAVPC